MTMEDTFTYIGISACGCVRAAVVDNPDHRADVRKHVTAFMRQGDTIERVKSDQIRFLFCASKHTGRKHDICPHPQACPERAIS